LYQVVHVHNNESCPDRSTEQAKRFSEWWQLFKSTPGVKVLAGYVAPMEHTFHITVESDDYPTLARALRVLNSWGTGHTSPVLPMEQTLPMAEAGLFRAP
jgi:hypothetical protein